MIRRGTAIGLVVAACLSVGAAWLGLGALDRAFPPPLEAAGKPSAELLDADGRLLRAFATREGRWRLKTHEADVDPLLVKMLIAYEDRRFYSHAGIDSLALGRAALQLVGRGRIVSGASTLSMQVARLIEPRQSRSFLAKLRQAARAVQIERRLDKHAILDLYLTHAPYGGNLEGVRAASLAYFGKEPIRLTPAEAALLVALPQLPERRRPDRFAGNALAARDRVLARMEKAGVISSQDRQTAEMAPLPKRRLELPMLAAHLGDAERRRQPDALTYPTRLKKDVQAALETVARQAAQRLPPKVAVAIIAANIGSGDIIARVGSAGYLDASRSGWIDMTRIKRSPGSTLKPMIYGLAFEQGMIAQDTVIEDRPADFAGYRPKNFDTHYQGDISIRNALQLSLNVPAVRLLEAVGPLQMLTRLKAAGIRLDLPQAGTPGLAIALGGVGTTLKDLVAMYAALARQGEAISLNDSLPSDTARPDPVRLLEPAAAWNVSDILSGVAPPAGARTGRIAYKTGTSYGYRDAWSIGYDGRTVIGVWIGRADNGAVPGLTGYGSAAPVLFEAFARSGLAPSALPTAPSGTVRLAKAELGPSLRRFSRETSGLIAVNSGDKPPVIVFPPEGAHVELDRTAEGSTMPLTLKLQAGRAPFRWLANGKTLPDLARTRTTHWLPDGDGYSTLTVIDAAGRSATVGIFLREN
ncbi:penicillin-binding protein 1C [Allorhizobium taibaishanense]|uniref:peptidoglycan glycosyltransferase n=1 Tax=Allorhizobium taibaishanense TaxID=887144 RepID=A0A1Q9A5A4_9HYPH|nr:penicillin-binding protein 1C [Allorhizobium taibaishanense]MBB4006872.1 penicillin-binding protein 1C [Allorhizobium taibaishanense]OLP49749.1 penicillin-binding protein 1C [Allorhizobium taibaishanense]